MAPNPPSRIHHHPDRGELQGARSSSRVSRSSTGSSASRVRTTAFIGGRRGGAVSPEADHHPEGTGRLLGAGGVEQGDVAGPHRAPGEVADRADHGEPLAFGPDPEPLADGILVGPVALRGFPIDDGTPECAGPVLLGKRPSPKDRDLHEPEVIRAHRIAVARDPGSSTPARLRPRAGPGYSVR